MQPRAAIWRARARYCSWLPPQPCTKSTPGAGPSPGVSSVPAMCWPSTGISRVSSCSDIRLHDGVLGEGSGSLVHAAEVYDRVRRRGLGYPIALDAPRTHGTQGGVPTEGLQRGHLGATRSPDSPRLLEHPATPAPLGTDAPHHVVVPPR